LEGGQQADALQVSDGTLSGKTPSREDDRNMTKKQACSGRIKEG
jgi:hypothetical protein